MTGNSREAKIGNAQHTTKEKYSDMREKKYRIREMADILGGSTDTLRFYEKKQVMRPEKGENGYRYYTKEDIRNFLWIRMFWISLKRTCFRRWKRKEL